MIVFEKRASTILFNLIRTHELQGPYLLPANVCPIVPITFFKARRSFEFIDITPDTLCMDPDALLKRWSAKGNKPAGILYVRTYGAVFDTTDIFATIKSITPDALIIDDRCLCLPQFDVAPNPYVDATLYSTGYAKQVDIGFGGYGVLRDDLSYTPAELTYNANHLSTITKYYKQILSTGLPFAYSDSDWLDTSQPQNNWETYRERVERELMTALKTKQTINSIYASMLPYEIQFPSIFQSWRFNINVKNKAAILETIRREALFASDHYDSLAGIFGPGCAPVAKSIHAHVINLFNDRYFSLEHAERLVTVLKGSKLLSRGPLFS